MLFDDEAAMTSKIIGIMVEGNMVDLSYHFITNNFGRCAIAIKGI
jgi:hypothetical protein